MQYDEWKEHISSLVAVPEKEFSVRVLDNSTSDPTANLAILLSNYQSKIDMVQRAAFEADEVIADQIIKAVTKGLSFVYFESRGENRCGREYWYECYRRFFYILDGLRN